uniref:Uncharacterized protein n=1 Tax=Psilocybe cubensis TaxID=181762 RepID=A0A8H7Y1X3_PSICU
MHNTLSSRITCDGAHTSPKGLHTTKHNNAGGTACVNDNSNFVHFTYPDENCAVNQDSIAVRQEKDTPTQRQQPGSIKMFESSSNLDISGGSFVSVARDYIHHEHKNTVIVMSSSTPLVPKSKSKSSARVARKKSSIGPQPIERPFIRSKCHSDSEANLNRLEKRIKDLEVSLNRLDNLAASITLTIVEESDCQPETKVYYSTDPAHPSHWGDHNGIAYIL